MQSVSGGFGAAVPAAPAPGSHYGHSGFPAATYTKTTTVASGVGMDHPAFISNSNLAKFAAFNPDLIQTIRSGDDTKFSAEALITPRMRGEMPRGPRAGFVA